MPRSSGCWSKRAPSSPRGDKRTAEQLGPVAKELLELGVTLHLGENYLEGLSGELIFKTPGMRFDNPALEQARARGCRVTSEIGGFF